MIKTYMYICVGLAILSLASTVVDGFMKYRIGDCDVTRTALDRFLANQLNVTDQLDSDLQTTRGKGGGNGVALKDSDRRELFYKRLRRAIFSNFLAFQANDDILKSALNTLAKRGHKQIDTELINRIIAEMPELMKTRLRWLEDEAIPSLERFPPQTQPYANVPLPESVKILNDAVPIEVVSDMKVLKEEVELLKNTLDRK